MDVKVPHRYDNLIGATEIWLARRQRPT